MSNLSQTITNCVFPPSDPQLLRAALAFLFKNTSTEEQNLLADPVNPQGMVLTRALQIAVDQNDVPCMLLLFSKERAQHLVNSEKATTVRHKKGLKFLSELLRFYEVDTTFDQLFKALLSEDDPSKPVDVFIDAMQQALASHKQQQKLTRAIAAGTTISTSVKKL